MLNLEKVKLRLTPQVSQVRSDPLICFMQRVTDLEVYSGKLVENYNGEEEHVPSSVTIISPYLNVF